MKEEMWLGQLHTSMLLIDTLLVVFGFFSFFMSLSVEVSF